MKRTTQILAGTMAALMLTTSLSTGAFADPLASAPKPVQVTIGAQAPDVRAPDVDITRKNGLFEAGYSKDGISYELKIKPDGTLQSIGEEVTYRPMPVSDRNDAIGDVASLTEDIADFAMAGNHGAVEDALIRYRDGLGEIRGMMDEATAAGSAKSLAAIEAALAANDMSGVAIAASDSFKTLELALDKTSLTVPLEVSMLDYVGFRLKAMAGAAKPDWAAMGTVVKEADGYWSVLEPTVKDKGLRDLMTSIHQGLSGAVAAKDAGMLSFAAQMELDAVDLLEHHFVAAWKIGAGAVAAAD